MGLKRSPGCSAEVMKGTVEIRGLRLFARHGVFAQEREVGNLFQVDVRVAYPMERAMREDCLDGTVNYAEVVGLIKEEMDIPSALLENVAWRIHERLMARYPAIEGGYIKVTKISPPIPAELDGVGVEIEW